jgi:hypothetical protein
MAKKQYRAIVELAKTENRVLSVFIDGLQLYDRTELAVVIPSALAHTRAHEIKQRTRGLMLWQHGQHLPALREIFFLPKYFAKI